MSGIIYSGLFVSILKEPYYSPLGLYLRDMRRSKGLPLRKVAAELDLDPSTLGKIEKNSRRASEDQIRKLAEIFAVDESALFTMHYSDLIANTIAPFDYREKILDAVSFKIQQTKIKEP